MDFRADIVRRMAEGPIRAERLVRRSHVALRDARVLHALVGDHAAIAWISTTDPSAIRFSPRIEFLVPLTAAVEARDAIMAAGFVPKGDQDQLFRESLSHSKLETVRLTSGSLQCDEIREFDSVPVLHLGKLVVGMLDRDWLDDRVNLRDMLDVGLIDQSWTNKLPSALAARLQTLIDTPDG